MKRVLKISIKAKTGDNLNVILHSFGFVGNTDTVDWYTPSIKSPEIIVESFELFTKDEFVFKGNEALMFNVVETNNTVFDLVRQAFENNSYTLPKPDYGEDAFSAILEEKQQTIHRTITFEDTQVYTIITPSGAKQIALLDVEFNYIEGYLKQSSE